MKQTLFIFCILFFFKGIAQIPINNISISMASTMPANISEWAPLIPPVMIQANIRTDSNRSIPPYIEEAKILVTIKNGGSKVCGSFTSENAPDANIKSLVKLYRGAEIQKLLGQTCTLKPGAYTLCVQFFGKPNGKAQPISEEIYKQFNVQGKNIETYTSPQNLLPADGKVFTEIEAKQSITFKWTPIIPRPQADLTYKVRVFEIRKGQSATEALKKGTSLLEKEVGDQTQFSFNLGHGSYVIANDSKYGWYVEAADKKGKIMGASTLTSFKLSSSAVQEEKQVIKSM